MDLRGAAARLDADFLIRLGFGEWDSPMANEDGADVVIVGTGVVGCLIAQQMLDAGLSVLMLEAGPRVDRWRIVENFRNLPPTLRPGQLPER